MSPLPLGVVVAVVAQAPQAPPRVAPPGAADSAVVVDGRLDEPVWARAARLRGFSQYLPSDNRPADDSTTVLVWYSPQAIYFGIRAYQDSGLVRATLADRDRIAGDDYVEILLDTYDDRRQAYVFGVNPLGVQADGTLRDAPRQSIDITQSVVTGAYTVDLGPDYVYQSKGRQTPWGYEVEMRVPFKTLRYQTRDPQDWGINAIRVVQATGHQHTWTRVLQTQASFLAQSGRLTGLTGLRRGLVLDATPEVTSTLTGAAQPSGWHYGGGKPRIGATVRWGLTANLTLDATAHPDFSQVEADVPQIQFDPRVALNFPEKRPFFLDGLELFQTPVQLIYTRRLVDPQAALTLTGKVGATTVALLSSVDAPDASATGTDHPLMNALRLRWDLSRQNNLGMVYTDRVEGAAFNRVGALDGTLTLGDVWALRFQGAGSVTHDAAPAPVRRAPLWRVDLARSGRRFGLDLKSSGVGDEFSAASGFIPRIGFVSNSVTPSYTVVGAPGSFIESFTANAYLALTWNQFRQFASWHVPMNRQDDMSAGFTLRGGWQVGMGVSVESFGYPASLYANYWVERVNGATVDTVPFIGQPQIANLDLGVNLQTPRGRSLSLSGFLLVGKDEDFYEWAPGRVVLTTVDLTWRPTDQLRAELIYDFQQVSRRDDGSQVALVRVPQLRFEYQLSRPIFLRLIGQYTSTEVDALRDESRTNGAILFRDPATGTFTRSAPSETNVLRIDWLFSYRPTPGTVVFVGYGSSLDDGAPFRFRPLSRVTDGFFAKLSYLFRE